MNIQTIKLSTIKPPKDNPRQSFHKDTIKGLANSIKSDGLLQNLVVTPTRGKKYCIISGERRYRALQLLLDNGDINKDYEISVEIRKNLSKQDKLRLATVENVQRENLHPMDEAEAFATLAQNVHHLPIYPQKLVLLKRPSNAVWRLPICVMHQNKPCVTVKSPSLWQKHSHLVHQTRNTPCLNISKTVIKPIPMIFESSLSGVNRLSPSQCSLSNSIREHSPKIYLPMKTVPISMMKSSSSPCKSSS